MFTHRIKYLSAMAVTVIFVIGVSVCPAQTEDKIAPVVENQEQEIIPPTVKTPSNPVAENKETAAERPVEEVQAPEPTEDAAVAEVPAAPAFMARIIGDDVNIRTGPATIYYPVGQLKKGSSVIVNNVKQGFAQIYPTPECFSYIAKQFVEIKDMPAAAEAEEATKATKLGVITGENVRVRAGSIKVPPANADVVQTKLNKGDLVHIIGERDEYYEIVCPPDTYFWVALDFIERTGGADKDAVREYVNAAREKVLGDGPHAPGVLTEADLDRKLYRNTVTLYQAEIAKPLASQDFAAVRQAIADLSEKTKLPSIKSSLSSLSRLVNRNELAVAAVQQSQQQDKLLAQSLAKIDERVESLVAVSASADNPQEMALQGKLVASAIFTAPTDNRRYLIFNKQGEIEAYVVPGNDQLDLGGWVDKDVSIIGLAEVDPISGTRIIKVKNLVEMPKTE